ncbi:MAG: glutathione S-transferase C-terminal domain-containing protein [Alphaproteobacteria bacterium]
MSVTLYGFGPALGRDDASPYVIKVETYLILAKIPYEKSVGMQYLKAAPKGKLPFIKDDNKVIDDSTAILQYLAAQYTDLDAHLSAEDKALSYILMKFLDEHFYWCGVRIRWQNEAIWQKVAPEMFATLPKLLQKIAPAIVRKKTLKKLQAQGTGAYSDDEFLVILQNALQYLSDFLGDKNYFLGGDIPTNIDATAYAFLSCFQIQIQEYLGQEAYAKYNNLWDYNQRILKSL